MIVVANSGPLISLARVGQLNLLETLYNQLYIPLAVREEVVHKGYGLPGASMVDAASWIQIRAIHDTVAVQLLRKELDAGESEAIILAVELQADLLLIDEARGRRVAEMRGLCKTGTLGTLIAAKKRYIISEVTPLLDDLRNAGVHMNRELYQKVRTLTGEN